MSRINLPLLAAIAILLSAGCSQESRDATAYRRQAEQLTHQNRRLQQDVNGASSLLAISNIAVVIVAGGLAVSLWHLMRSRGAR